MTNEHLQRQMEFIVETLALVSINDEKRQQEIYRHDQQTDRIERILKLMVRAGLRERRTRRQQNEQYEQRFHELLKSKAHTDRRLDALIDIVGQQRNGDA